MAPPASLVPVKTPQSTPLEAIAPSPNAGIVSLEPNELQEIERGTQDDSTSDDELAYFVQHTPVGLKRLLFFVPTMNCAGCMRKIERHFEGDDRYKTVRVNLSQKQVLFEWPDETGTGTDKTAGTAGKSAPIVTGSEIDKELRHLGFDVRPLAAAEESAEAGSNELRQLIWCLAVAGFAAANVMLLSVSVWSGADGATRDLFHWLSALIAIPAIAYAGRPFFSSAATALRAGHLNMDVPISLAVVLAAGLSLYETWQHGEHAFFDAAISLLFFLLIGRVLDKMMRERAFSGVRQLLALKTQTAMMITAEGKTQAVAVKTLKPGMLLAIAPGETLPVDGQVVAGESDVDWSLVNGESIPRPARQGDKLFSGLVNLTGPMQVRVTAVGEDTLLSDIIRMMENAEETAPQFQRVADKAAAIYAPVVHIAALLTFIGWMMAGQAVDAALYTAISVLIITCPCALGLAVPVVQVVANAIAYRQGILMKDGSALEKLGHVDAVYFDKTGTLTTGMPQLSGAYYQAFDLLPAAAKLASHSLHPLSKALVKLGDERGVDCVGDFINQLEVPSSGIEGFLAGRRFRIGTKVWCEIPSDLSALQNAEIKTGALTLWVSALSPSGELEFGLFTFEDELRPGAAQVTQWLRDASLPLTLLSGDRVEAAKQMADDLKIETYKGELKPAEKAADIMQAGREGQKVLMIGDGINDGPSLKAAYVSASLQSASDVAQVTAGFVIMGRELTPLIGLFKLADKTKWLVRQNFALAALYNLIAVPLAVFGGVTPIVAAIAMSASSLIVTLNALRLYYLARPSEWQTA